MKVRVGVRVRRRPNLGVLQTLAAAAFRALVERARIGLVVALVRVKGER